MSRYGPVAIASSPELWATYSAPLNALADMTSIGSPTVRVFDIQSLADDVTSTGLSAYFPSRFAWRPDALNVALPRSSSGKNYQFVGDGSRTRITFAAGTTTGTFLFFANMDDTSVIVADNRDIDGGVGGGQRRHDPHPNSQSVSTWRTSRSASHAAPWRARARTG